MQAAQQVPLSSEKIAVDLVAEHQGMAQAGMSLAELAQADLDEASLDEIEALAQSVIAHVVMCRGAIT